MAETAKYDTVQAAGYRQMSEYEERIVTETLQEFGQLQLYRNTHAAEWEEIAELIAPPDRNTFFFGNYNWPGQKKTDRQVDATGMLALHRFGAILDSLLTPRNMIWHQLGSDADYLMKDRQVRLWYEAATRKLFQMRYAPIGNYSANNQQVYQSLGKYGTGSMFIDQATNAWNVPIPALRYKCIPMGELFMHENHQGLVDGVIRWFRLTARQAYQKWGDAIPATLKAAMDQKSETKFNFLHRICPRADYEHGMLNEKGKPYASYYVSIEGRCLLQEGGYRHFPMAISRYDQTPGEVYGRGPASFVLPAMKTLNAEKRTFLKVGHRAADPVLLTADDGMLDGFSLRPGTLNKGGVTQDGKPLVHVLPTGEIQISKEMMEEERNLTNDGFLVSLFQILTETPTMTATEVIERTSEKGILLAPTVGRQSSEYLGPKIDRELDLLASFGALPPMPPLLREARGDYNVTYTNPLSRAQRAQEVAGFQRTIQSTLEVVKVTQDPSPFDVFDFDVATVETARIQAVPESWMADDKAVQAKRKNRADAQQRQEQIQAMPAQAAMLKAQQSADAKGLVTNNVGAGQSPGAVPQGPPQGGPQ